MTSVIIFGPTGQVGSVAALTAAKKGATVWLAMRDPSKSIPGLTKEKEEAGSFHRVQADFKDVDSVSKAAKTSGAKSAFIYLAHGGTDHQKGTITALKDAGIESVVFLSSFTIPTKTALRECPTTDLIPFVHAQVEATLDDVYGSDHYVAIRAGAFASNILREKSGIIAGEVKMYGGKFVQDNVAPSDLGRVAGNILVSGPKNGQKKVYVYGPEPLSLHDTVLKIGNILGKEIKITDLSAEEGYEKYVSAGMPAVYAKYMVDVQSNAGPDKGDGERFPNYEEGVKNVELYTGKPSMTLEKWVEENKEVLGN